jgi:hypothetical protein
MRHPVVCLDRETRKAIRAAVKMAMDFWPESRVAVDHRATSRRRAFAFLRRQVARSGNVMEAVVFLEMDAQSYE